MHWLLFAAFENGPKGGRHTTVHLAGHRSQVFIAMRFSELLLDAARNSFTAVSFLAAAGLLVAPASCPKCGKAWKLHTPLTRSQPYFWCWSRTRLRTSRAKRRCCNTKRTWHFYCPLAKKLPKMLPGLLLQVLYHFAQRRAIECAAFETDLHRNTMKDLLDEVEAQPELLEELEQRSRTVITCVRMVPTLIKNSDFWQSPRNLVVNLFDSFHKMARPKRRVVPLSRVQRTVSNLGIESTHFLWLIWMAVEWRGQCRRSAEVAETTTE